MVMEVYCGVFVNMIMITVRSRNERNLTQRLFCGQSLASALAQYARDIGWIVIQQLYHSTCL